MGSKRDTRDLEQRRSQRFKVELAVKVHLSDSGRPTVALGTGSNISDGGMQLFISRNLEVGQIVTLEVSLPYRRKELTLRAVIKNRVSFNYGVEFVNPSEQDREVILQNCRVLALMQ